MRTFAGLAVIVLGVFLVISGMAASDSLGSRLTRLFNGAPTDRTIWLLVGGVFALVVGASMAFHRRGQRA